MKLILDAIKALYRKMESRIANISWNNIKDRPFYMSTDALGQPVYHKLDRRYVDLSPEQGAIRKLEEKSRRIYLTTGVNYNFRNTPMNIGETKTVTRTERRDYMFRDALDGNYVDQRVLSDAFSWNGRGVPAMMLFTITTPASTSDAIYITNASAPIIYDFDNVDEKPYQYNVRGIIADSSGLYTVVADCNDGLTVTITRVA